MSDAIRSEGGGDERDLVTVPVGLEHVLALAATHPEFRQALQRDPDATQSAAALALTATERAILKATPPEALDQMIQRVDSSMTTPDRRQFLERATAAVALLVGGEALLGCNSDKGKEYGKPKAPVQVKEKRRYGTPRAQMGARRDHPQPAPAMKRPQPPPTRPSATEATDPAPRPEPKPRPRPRRRRPAPPASMGARPDRGEPMSPRRRRRRPRSYGIRPDRRLKDPFDL